MHLHSKWNEIVKLAHDLVELSDDTKSTSYRICKCKILRLLRECRFEFGNKSLILATLGNYIDHVRPKLGYLRKGYDAALIEGDYEGALACATSAIRFLLEIQNLDEIRRTWINRVISIIDRCSDDWEISEAQTLISEVRLSESGQGH